MGYILRQFNRHITPYKDKQDTTPTSKCNNVCRKLSCVCPSTESFFVVHNSIRKLILEVVHDLSNIKIFQKNNLFKPEMIIRPLFCFKDKKNTSLLIFNLLQQKKLIFNFFVNRN